MPWQLAEVSLPTLSQGREWGGRRAFLGLAGDHCPKLRLGTQEEKAKANAKGVGKWDNGAGVKWEWWGRTGNGVGYGGGRQSIQAGVTGVQGITHTQLNGAMGKGCVVCHNTHVGGGHGVNGELECSLPWLSLAQQWE